MSGNGNGKKGKQGGKLRRFTTSLPFDQQENVEQYQAQLSETDQVRGGGRRWEADGGWHEQWSLRVNPLSTHVRLARVASSLVARVAVRVRFIKDTERAVHLLSLYL